jgi:hypothetical protein
VEAGNSGEEGEAPASNGVHHRPHLGERRGAGDAARRGEAGAVLVGLRLEQNSRNELGASGDGARWSC